MINQLSMIVKNQTEIVNSIESNLIGTRDYIAKAADHLEKAKVEYKKGNGRMCCIVVCIVIIMLVCMVPIMMFF